MVSGSFFPDEQIKGIKQREPPRGGSPDQGLQNGFVSEDAEINIEIRRGEYG